MVELLHEGPPVITDRQRQVMELIADGGSTEEVARRLGISPRTAKAHSDVLRQKLGCARRRQIPRAYRSLTGRDPLAKSLGGAPTSPGDGRRAPAASRGRRRGVPDPQPGYPFERAGRARGREWKTRQAKRSRPDAATSSSGRG